MEAQWQGDELIVTDEVSGRVVSIPRVVMVGRSHPGAGRAFLARAVFEPDTIHGVKIVREGPYGMTPQEMRAKLAPEHWQLSGAETTDEQRAAHLERIEQVKNGTYVHPFHAREEKAEQARRAHAARENA